MPREDDEDDTSRRPRARRSDEGELDEGETPRSKRRRDDVDEDYEAPEDRKGKRKQGDVTGGIIPYKNGMALASYYCGVFGLIPCLGLFLAPIAFILGILGLRYAKKNPEARGQAHAIVGIVLSILIVLGTIAAGVYIYSETNR